MCSGDWRGTRAGAAERESLIQCSSVSREERLPGHRASYSVRWRERHTCSLLSVLCQCFLTHCLLISVPGVLGSLFSVESSKSFLPCLLLSAPVFPFSPYSVFVWCYLSALVSALSMTSGSLPFSLLILHYVHTHTHIHTQGGGREMHRDSYTHIHTPHKHTHIHTLTHTERQIYTNSYT